MTEELRKIKAQLDNDPTNGDLWLKYAGLLRSESMTEEAVSAFHMALEFSDQIVEIQRDLIVLLRETGKLTEAYARAVKFLGEKEDPYIRREVARIMMLRGDTAGAVNHYMRAITDDESLSDPALDHLCWGESPKVQPTAEPEDEQDSEERDLKPALAEVAPDASSYQSWAHHLAWGGLPITFKDVGGLDDVKKQIHLKIIAPFKNPEIFKAFKRTGGGGLLLYGPPGCGKTHLARATAGECGATFLFVAIHDVVDKYWGESEKLVHSIFEEARATAPSIIFFDEFDALGSKRGSMESQFWRTLVDQLLQEMDGFAYRNENVLLFAATNAPWNVDVAFRRPGRFDRVLFIPPPDHEARKQILNLHIVDLPGASAIQVDKIAKDTALMTGADLKALCERAAEAAIERSILTGNIEPVTMADFAEAGKRMQTSAAEWLATAKNFARYSNEGGQYDELVNYLKSIKRW